LNLNFHKFKEALGPFICFSLQDARKHFPDFDRKRLTEWQKKGYIRNVIRRHYIFTDIPEDAQLWWYVSNQIFEPSYISLQSALSYYGFIPEAVFQVTSITTRLTRTFDAPEMRFIYRNMKKSLYFGYTLIPFTEKHHIRLAEPEKALLDLLYLNNSMENEEDFEAWRFNKQLILESISVPLIVEYGKIMQNQSFYNRLIKFKKWLDA
jgi:hypothetical protein